MEEIYTLELLHNRAKVWTLNSFCKTWDEATEELKRLQKKVEAGHYKEARLKIWNNPTIYSADSHKQDEELNWHGETLFPADNT